MKSIITAGTSPQPTRMEQRNRHLARRAAEEGIVLLKNDGVLPLKDRRIALYGSGARKTIKGGIGSGAVHERHSVTIEEGLLASGYEITTTSWLDRFDRFYDECYEEYRLAMEEKVKGITNFYQILGMIPPFKYPTGCPITPEDLTDCDTALFVLARQAGEGNDRRDVQGDYRLDDVERECLETLSKAYRHLVVIINAGGVVDVSFMDQLRVSAVVYYVQSGEEGGNALANLLSGRTNFSGRLATGWAREFSDLPSNSTYSYLGGDPHNQEYNEGIYVGYRFFTTFRVKPRFPFGFGLSYTTFQTECTPEQADGQGIRIRYRVKNIGRVWGRETVQLYASVPDNQQGTEAVRLCAFAKSEALEPGQEETLTLNVPVKNLACYDSARSCWVLRAGEYVIYAGQNSEELNPFAVLVLAQEQILEVCFPACPPQHAIHEITPPARRQTTPSDLPRIVWTGDFQCTKHCYEPLPEPRDPLADTLTREQLVELVCGAGTSARDLQVTAMGASGSTTARLYESAGIPNVILSDGPAGLNLTTHVVEMPDGSLRPANVPEVVETYKRYSFGVSKYAMQRQLVNPKDGVVHYQYATAWPCSQLLAQTFDTALMEEIGDAIGAEMEAYGVTVWLGPGMNIHRNPLCGRTFEYYSEDPLLSGKLAGAITRGVQKHPGKGVSVKHFAANSCELERNASSSNMSERTLREIYLRGFEIAVKESQPATVMAAYNMINGVYCTNNDDLLVKILRNEWGFEGLVMSDWDAMKAMPDDCMRPATADVLKAHAAQCDLVCPGRRDQVEALKLGMEAGLVNEADVRRSAARILRLIRSNSIFPVK